LSPRKSQDRDNATCKTTNSKRSSKARSSKKRVVDSDLVKETNSKELELDYDVFDERRSASIVYAPRSQSYWRRLAQGLQERVDSGDVSACWRLARLYEDGRGVKRDWKRMLELLERGAENNEPNATARLGLCYEYAIGVQYDPERSWAYYEKAANLADDFELVGLVQGRLLEREAEKKTRFIFFMTSRKKNAKRQGVETMFATDDPQDGVAFLKTTERVQTCCSAYSFKRIGLLFSKLGRPDELSQDVACSFLERAFAIWRAEAKLGNLTARLALSEFISAGIIEDESGEFGKFLVESLNVGYAPGVAQFAFNMEEQGLDLAAIGFYRQACESNWPDALYKAGALALNRLGDVDLAAEYFQRGAKLNHAPSIYSLGDYYWNVEARQDRRRAVELFRRAAEMDLGIAQERYADYLNSETRMIVEGLPPDPKEAFSFYRRAGNNGRELSRVAVACMIYEGKGVKQNCEQADELFEQILTYGEPKTKETLALRFLNTPCYETKVKLALQTLEETAKELPTSYVVLGFYYYDGKHIPRDLRRAVEYFGLAAAEGEAVGAINFARCCYDGAGVRRNPLVGEYFLRLAASQADPVAAFQLGEFYATCDDSPSNRRYAFEWYRLAVQLDYGDAFSKLAECYWNGLGVERDCDKAIQLWTSAASFDDEQASESLERAKIARMVQKIFEREKVKKTRASKRNVKIGKVLDETKN